MLTQALLNLLEPAYGPCVNFSGACAGACMWEPARGLVPCAFGGATGTLDEVRLIIVTAEPGDPPDNTGYAGTPYDMVGNSLRIFHAAMREGSFERTGRHTPFHRNMRRILDAFWPNDDLEAQLRKTWFTNAVLCPAEVSGGKHPERVEQACAQTYLSPQLDLFPNAFVLALGAKARDRIQAAGLRLNSVGLHPSSRASNADKMSSWAKAASLFRGEQSEAPASPQAAQPQHPPALRVKAAAPSPRLENTVDLENAIVALPPDIGEFVQRLSRHPDYECRAGRMQLTVFYRGVKVGGLNRQAAHWYFSKVFVRNHGDLDTMATHGFRHVVDKGQHDYWVAQGLEAQSAFEDAMVTMTGVRP